MRVLVCTLAHCTRMWHRQHPPCSRLPLRSILYQRGIYPPEAFTPVAKYGLSILVTQDEGLKTYLVQVLRQLSGACEQLTIEATRTCC